MTRHARNCTAGAVYTYHEKKKDGAASGYGSVHHRLGKDSVRGFDCCNLTLQPCRDPVLTRDGYLFDKEAILQYIITKKNEHSRKLKEFERQKKKDEDELAEIAAAEKRSNLIKFMDGEKNIVSGSSKTVAPTGSDSVSNMANGLSKDLPSFWVPSQLPDAKKTRLKKPEGGVFCPVTGHPLKMKDLIDVKWTLVKDPDDKKSLIAKENRYMCPVTHDILSNSVACVVLAPTGDVVTQECVDRIISKDWTHPLSGKPLTQADLIRLQRGGTGYSATNSQLEGTATRPALQA